jgi:phage-related protein
MREAADFLRTLPTKVRDKITYNIHRVQMGELDAELFKKLEGTEIWEFRTLYNGIAYRLFAFWDTRANTLVIATHGIVKKNAKDTNQRNCKGRKIKK